MENLQPSTSTGRADTDTSKKRKKKPVENHDGNIGRKSLAAVKGNIPNPNSSEMTLYQGAVILDIDGNSSKRDSSSSEEAANKSGNDSLDKSFAEMNIDQEQVLFQKFLDARLEEYKRKSASPPMDGNHGN